MTKPEYSYPILRFCLIWRSGRDSNPRGIAPKLISSQPRYDHFDTAAYMVSPHRRKTALGKLLAFREIFSA